VHQAYIEPHATIAKVDADGQGRKSGGRAGTFRGPALTASAQHWTIGDLRVPRRDRRSRFGGKTVVFMTSSR